MNTNNLGHFNINMKEIEVDKDIKRNDRSVFDQSNPEGSYTLNLAETYDHIIL